ncbi:hypothetical protein BDK51DRAFT_30969, partial [Blyttiomyces helicus]
KIKVSRAGAVAQDEPVFGANKESEVEQEDPESHTAEDDDEDGIFDNDIKVDHTCCWNKAATRNTTKAISVAKRKAKKDQPTPVEGAYTCDPLLKKLKSTEQDTEAFNNELVVPARSVSKGKTPIKNSD